MAHPQDHFIREFAVFSLPVTATLADLDERLFKCYSSVRKERRKNPKRAEALAKDYDRAYGVLLRQFLQRTVYGSRAEVTIEDLRKHRDRMGEQPMRPVVCTTTRLFQDSDLEDDVEMDGTEEAEQEVDEREHLVIGMDAKSSVPATYQRHDDEDNIDLDEAVPQVEMRHGDMLVEAPDMSIIVHATNCLGVWGAGFALQLKNKFPGAFTVYRDHCAKGNEQDLVGTCLLIKPHPADYAVARNQRNKPRRFVACLFTSVGYGRQGGDNASNPGRDARDVILRHTDSALYSLVDQLHTVDLVTDPVNRPGDLFSNKFNSGQFAVPWAMTKRVLDDAYMDFIDRIWTVYEPVRSARKQLKIVVDRTNSKHDDDESAAERHKLEAF